MADFLQTCTINTLYVYLFLIIYNLFTTNYFYIRYIVVNLILCNYHSLIILINLIGIYLFLKKVTFEISIKCSFNPQII